MSLLLDEQRLHLEALQPQVKELGESMGVDKLKPELERLTEITAQPDFWNDSDNSQKVLKEIKIIKDKLDKYNNLQILLDDTLELIQLAVEMNDNTVEEDVLTAVSQINKELEDQKLATLLNGEYDQNNAIITFHSGAGGTEAQDWAEMLYRMYTRWAERRGYSYDVLDYQDGDEAGLKSATILIKGTNAYGYLKSESGVHRLVRISPFDSSGKRHTSFASLEIIPEIDDTIEVDIDETDLRVDTYRASGAGGQHVNKTESAVRITHIPTGIVVSCQNERSQRQNRETAMKTLMSQLVEIKEREHLDHINDIKGEHKDNAWGSQIRSYVFMPYTMVKDHRTNHEEGNINAVMDGDIDAFIDAYLRDKNLGKI